MSSKDRKRSSKELSNKTRTSEYGDHEVNLDKAHRKSSSKVDIEKKERTDKKHFTIEKDMESEYKFKINKHGDIPKDEKQRHRIKEEYLNDKGKRKGDSDNKHRNEKEQNEDSNELKRHRKKEREDELDRRERHHKKEKEGEFNEARNYLRKDKEDELDGREKRHKKVKEEELNESKRHQKKDRKEEFDERERRHKKNKDGESKESIRPNKKDREEIVDMRINYRRDNENEDIEKGKAKKNQSEIIKTNDNRRETSGNYKDKDISQDKEKRRHRSKIGESSEYVPNKKLDKDDENLEIRLEGKNEQHKRRSNLDKDLDRKYRDSTDKRNISETVIQDNKSRSSLKQTESRNDLEEVAYDDDFENYDDEEFEEIAESSRASNEPPHTDNSSNTSKSSKQTEKAASPVRPAEILKQPTKKIGQFQSSFINFKIAQKKYSHDLVANRMLSRAYDLSRLIEMDRVDYDILEMAPVLKHSQYMRLFGKEGCQHEGSQTGSDNVSRESQTEVIDERIVWTQFPPFDENECFQIVFNGKEVHCRNPAIHRSDENTSISISDELIMSSGSLVQTLATIENLLEEEASCEVEIKMAESEKNGKQMISKGYSKYSISIGIDCLIARFAISNSNIFATVHQASKMKTSQDNQSQMIPPIAIWKVSRSTKEPLMHLSCPSIGETQSTISHVTFSPDPAASHIICGLNSGALALWDLRENLFSRSHKIILPPAYLTSAPSEDREFYHKGPIVGLQPVDNEMASSSYQLISLDSFGQMFIWMVSPVSQANQWSLASGSLADLNLRPGARYQLSKVSSMQLIYNVAGVSNPYVVTAVTLDPSCNSHLFCGTNTGQIIEYKRLNHRITNNHSISHPKSLGETDIFETGTVTQLDFYPFFEPYLLAGYDDGMIRIFAVGKSKYLMSFQSKPDSAILRLKWSRSHPAIFFSLDVEGNLCAWNILLNQNHPIHIQTLPGYIGFDVSTDSKWGLKEKTSAATSLNINNKARLLLWALDGRIEVHELSEAFSNPDLDDSFKMFSLFQSLI